MVQQRKLIEEFVANFPDLSAEASAANKGVSQEDVRFRAFLRAQIRGDW